MVQIAWVWGVVDFLGGLLGPFGVVVFNLNRRSEHLMQATSGDPDLAGSKPNASQANDFKIDTCHFLARYLA